MINRAIKTVMGMDVVTAMRLDRLYVLDGRHLPSHEFHNSYAGLIEKAEELEENEIWMSLPSLQRIEKTTTKGLLTLWKIAKSKRKKWNF